MWHKTTLVCLTILAVAFASAFIVFVTMVQSGITDGAVKGYGPYELVIGAEGSESQLMLHTFYHIGAPTGNISYEMMTEIENCELAEVAYPMTRGDSYKGFPLIGVPTGYLSTRYSEAVLSGKLYEKPGQVVIGAHVSEKGSLKIGDHFHASHGAIEDDVHDELEYEVVGILPTLGTPDDKGIFTTLDHAWIVHDDTGHTPGKAAKDIDEGDITTIVVKPKGIMELQALEQLFNGMDGIQATYSGKTISDLLSILDTGSAMITILSLVCVVIATISVLLSLMAVTAERKKDIGLLRLLGKSKGYIISTMLMEGVFITILGGVVGIVLGHISSFMLRSTIFEYAGITISPWAWNPMEWYIIIGAIVLGLVAAIIPALRSYQVNPLILFYS